MQLIKHRVNDLALLASLPPGLGAEIDLRSRGHDLILHHDAFAEGARFADFLPQWQERPRGTLILNPKEDGLENAILAELNKFRITDFFFLDLTLPTTVRLCVKEKVRRVALRYSEYEPRE